MMKQRDRKGRRRRRKQLCQLLYSRQKLTKWHALMLPPVAVTAIKPVCLGVYDLFVKWQFQTRGGDGGGNGGVQTAYNSSELEVVFLFGAPIDVDVYQQSIQLRKEKKEKTERDTGERERERERAAANDRESAQGQRMKLRDNKKKPLLRLRPSKVSRYKCKSVVKTIGHFISCKIHCSLSCRYLSTMASANGKNILFW
jgi:hypothetical protein